MHVAVVDDQESSLAGFSQILRRVADLEPICFKKASDALHWVGGVDPAFIVVKSALADIPGIDFIRRLRLTDGRKDTPVIFTTGKPDRELRPRRSKSGSMHFSRNRSIRRSFSRT